MSLILEALRKSEAERRRGQAPGLFTPDAAALMPRHARGSRWLLLSAVVLALLALAVAGWWWWPAGQPTQDGVPAGASANPGRDTATPRPPAPTPATPIASTAASASPMPTAAMPASPTAATAPATAATPLATTPATARPAFADRPPPTPLRDPDGLATAGTATPSPQALPSPPASNVDEPPAVTLAVLPSGRRSQLPPLRLSMHVYNDEAARRFAIVDGQRITEGSQLGPATVRSIRRDGVLIELDGERYLLPRP